MFKLIKHKLGFCHKSRSGYNCHGRSNYNECGVSYEATL